MGAELEWVIVWYDVSYRVRYSVVRRGVCGVATHLHSDYCAITVSDLVTRASTGGGSVVVVVSEGVGGGGAVVTECARMGL